MKAADASVQHKISVKCLEFSRNLHSKDREHKLFCQPYKTRDIHSLINVLEKLTGGSVLLNNSQMCFDRQLYGFTIQTEEHKSATVCLFETVRFKWLATWNLAESPKEECGVTISASLTAFKPLLSARNSSWHPTFLKLSITHLMLSNPTLFLKISLFRKINFSDTLIILSILKSLKKFSYLLIS